MTEIQIMRDLKDCGNVVKIHKLYESESYINILMEYHEGGNLSSVLEGLNSPLTEDEVRLISAQLLLTIDFM
jgi:serine/threonine protein kinase